MRRDVDAVTMRLTGGLGNQLFILAAGLSISEINGLDLRLDVGDLANDPVRTFELDQFAWSDEVDLARMLRFRWARGRPKVILRNAYRIQKRLYVHAPDNAKGRGLRSDWRGVTGTGYFQSPRWITPRTAALLRDGTQAPATSSDAFHAWSERLRRLGEWISVHVRRGDYAAAGSMHPLLGRSYYRNALDAIRRGGAADELPVVMFTDDATGAAADLVRAEIVVAGDIPLTSAETMLLMAGSSHVVIANSSFSWWAAFLRDRAGRRVVAPDLWTRGLRTTACELPPHWATVPAG